MSKTVGLIALVAIVLIVLGIALSYILPNSGLTGRAVSDIQPDVSGDLRCAPGKIGELTSEKMTDSLYKCQYRVCGDDGFWSQVNTQVLSDCQSLLE